MCGAWESHFAKHDAEATRLATSARAIANCDTVKEARGRSSLSGLLLQHARLLATALRAKQHFLLRDCNRLQADEMGS